MHELHGAAVRRLEGEHAIAKVVEQVHVLLHVVADDGRLLHQRQRRIERLRARSAAPCSPWRRPQPGPQ